MHEWSRGTNPILYSSLFITFLNKSMQPNIVRKHRRTVSSINVGDPLNN